MIFGLPGAVTPICSSKQLPGFEHNYEASTSAGVDDTCCVSANDAFVIYQWGQHQGLKNVKLRPDGHGDFMRWLGMLIDKGRLGFGLRSWR